MRVVDTCKRQTVSLLCYKACHVRACIFSAVVEMIREAVQAVLVLSVTVACMRAIGGTN